MSSYSGLNEKVPLAISASTRASPSWIAASSVAVMIPCWAGIAAWARLPARSWVASLLSKPMETLISAIMAEGPAANLPPHNSLAAGSPLGGLDGKSEEEMGMRTLTFVLVAAVIAVAAAFYVMVTTEGEGQGNQTPDEIAGEKPAGKAAGAAGGPSQGHAVNWLA